MPQRTFTLDLKTQQAGGERMGRYPMQTASNQSRAGALYQRQTRQTLSQNLLQGQRALYSDQGVNSPRR